MSDPSRIAVLGAGGFLGSHLVPALSARFDCEIDAIDVTFRKLGATSHSHFQQFLQPAAAVGVRTLRELGRSYLTISALTTAVQYSMQIKTVRPRNVGCAYRPREAGDAALAPM